MSEFINIGNDSFVNKDFVFFIKGTDSEKLKRTLKRYGIERKSERVWDAAPEREPRSMMVLNNGFVVTSFLSPQVIAKRANLNIKLEGTFNEQCNEKCMEQD